MGHMGVQQVGVQHIRVQHVGVQHIRVQHVQIAACREHVARLLGLDMNDCLGKVGVGGWVGVQCQTTVPKQHCNWIRQSNIIGVMCNVM